MQCAEQLLRAARCMQHESVALAVRFRLQANATPSHIPHSPTPPPSDAVGILLYRKHVITDQPYISQLIETMEAEGLRPLPIFINGVEAHTVVSACRVLLGGCGWMAATVRAGKRGSVPAGCVR